MPTVATAGSTFGEATVVSVGLLFRRDPLLVAPLLLVQVLYKFTTPFTVGTIANPVVISNLVIAALHLTTLGLILLSGRRAGHALSNAT